jgi:hypothetical protein
MTYRYSEHKVFRLILMIFFILITLVLSQGCRTMTLIDQSDVTGLDYGKQESWLLLPSDPDAYAVDVFYAYPTVYQGEGVQDITDPAQRAAAMVPVRTQASVFSGAANLYVPMYRQLGKAGFSQPETFEEHLAIGEEDLRQALLSYLDHHNQGRPFFIAAHSQGSSTLISLLRKIWGSTGAEDRMIATYLIGFSITQDDMEANPAIRMSEGPQDTGCFIAYNSLQDGLQDQSVQVLQGAVVTNPLSWVSSASDGAYVDASEHLGAVFFTEDGYEPVQYDHFTSAQVKGQALVCEISDPSVLSSYPIAGIYHPDDYSLFYENLREHIQEQIATFLQ